MLTEEQLRELASQLRNPKGAQGLETADHMNISNHKMMIHSFENAGITPNQSILEIGFANGKHLPAILKKYKIKKYYGLEISDLMIDEALRTLTDIDQAQINIQKYDGTHIPENIKQMDRVLSVNTIYFWDHPEELMHQIYNCLSVHGKLILTFATADFMKQLPFTKFGFELYSIEKAEELFKKSEFSSLEIVRSQDRTISKSGDEVLRDFVSCIFSK